jgi:hypothetical protein
LLQKEQQIIKTGVQFEKKIKVYDAGVDDRARFGCLIRQIGHVRGQQKVVVVI